MKLEVHIELEDKMTKTISVLKEELETTVLSIPTPFSPANASPLSFNSTLLYCALCIIYLQVKFTLYFKKYNFLQLLYRKYR